MGIEINLYEFIGTNLFSNNIYLINIIAEKVYSFYPCSRSHL